MADPKDYPPMICDRCGELVKPGEARYALADKPERGRGRHYRCHKDPIDELREALGGIRRTLGRLRDG